MPQPFRQGPNSPGKRQSVHDTSAFSVNISVLLPDYTRLVIKAFGLCTAGLFLTTKVRFYVEMR
jgi:hypothetical protein